MLRLAKSPKTQDRSEIKSAAHALKSMSLNVGATILAQSCATIEESALENSGSTDLIQLVKVASRDYRRAISALPQLIEHFSQRAA